MATASAGSREKPLTKCSRTYCQRSKLAVKKELDRILPPPAAYRARNARVSTTVRAKG